MLLSREWLSDFTDIKASDKEYCDAMTLSGSKVEGYEVTGSEISNVVVGKVLEIVRHENSDHMWICQIDVGNGNPIQIVTGAQNVKQGDLVPVALDGATLPGGKEIHTGELRGVESRGMLCSIGELSLDTHDFPYAIEDGIFIIEEDCKVGDDIKAVVGYNDTVVEFEITNNRTDCYSMIGLARESAATFDKPFNLNTPSVKGSGEKIEDYLSVSIDDPDLCPRYTAKMAKNIKIGHSPLWMRRRLRACGVRPINNIVDITNYVMIEYGQPMHAFDYSCVGGKQIIVRKAQDGETLTTLDEKERPINPDMLIIADETKPIALAGVMGGGNSEISDKTTTIVFESANFNGTSVRKTAIALGMRTDASSKYEKGLDPYNALPAVERACELVEMLGAGEVMDGTVDVFPAPTAPVKVKLEPDRINSLLGTDIDRDFMVSVLSKLEMPVEGDMISVPSFRQDINHCADVTEEIARFYGYDKIGDSLFSGEATKGGYSPKQQFERSISAACRGMGFYEVMTYSFGSKTAWDKIHLPADSKLRDAFVIQNPLGEDTSVMRTTALPSMLSVLATNLSKRNMDVKLFELATTYKKLEGSELACEQVTVTMGEYGKDADFFALKGNIEALFKALRIDNVKYVAESNVNAYHPGRCAKIYCGERELGIMGQIHPQVADEYDMNTDVYTAELDMAEMMNCESSEPTYIPLPRFPAVSRDIALLSDVNITVAELEDTMRNAGGELLESVKLFDVYTGKGIPEGKRSVAFSITIRSKDQTLTDEQAEGVMKSILADLEKRHGAVIR